jgi:hypothetical protein
MLFVRCLEITNASSGALYYNSELLMGSNSTFMHEEIVSNPAFEVRKELESKSAYYYFKSKAFALRSPGLVVVFDDEAGATCPLFFSKIVSADPIIAEFKCYHLDRAMVRLEPREQLQGLLS